MENIIFINSCIFVHSLRVVVDTAGVDNEEKKEKIVHENLLLEFDFIFVLLNF